jgi:hypothetical protein
MRRQILADSPAPVNDFIRQIKSPGKAKKQAEKLRFFS